ncbi:MAG: AAA family ATPase [Actinobacteria bacterium]|nr:AAA family ATPase [Actinomycetota bacterium]
MAINEGQVGVAVRRDSPWWRSPAWADSDRDLRDVRSSGISYDPRPLAGIVPGGLYLLYGPRRVGKTVSVKRAIEELLATGIDPLQIARVSVDGWQSNRLGTLYEYVVRVLTSSIGNKHRYWFIDEITASTGEWWSVVKNLRDNTAFGDDCIVLTGSSNAGLDEAIKAFAGRRGTAVYPDRTLLPMDFGDFCTGVGADLPQIDGLRADELLSRRAEATWLDLARYTDDLVAAWQAYLEVGGYPNAVADWRRSNRVEVSTTQALWDVVRGEALTTAMNEAVLGAVLGGISSRLTGLVNQARFAEDTGVTRGTLSTRIDALIGAFLAWSCPRSTSSGAPDYARQRKLYFLDPLVAQLPHLIYGHESPDITRLNEQQLGVALLAWNERVQPGSIRSAQWVTHHRGTKGSEIDFAGICADSRQRSTPIEAKYVSDAWRQDALSIANSTLRHGIVATRDILEVSGANAVWAVPASFVAYALSSYSKATLNSRSREPAAPVVG